MMFREECPEFLNIRLGYWCSNGGRLSRAVWNLVTSFFATICDGHASLGLLKQNMCQNDLLTLVKLRSSLLVSTTQIG